MEGSTGQFQRKGGKSAAQKCGQVPGMEGSTEGNFRGKVERVECSAEAAEEAGWLQLQLQVPEKKQRKGGKVS